MTAPSAPRRPRLALLHGEPGGVGPELAARLLADAGTRARADLLLVGDRHVFELGARQAGVALELETVEPETVEPETVGDTGGRSAAAFPVLDCATLTAQEVRIAEVSEAGGRACLRALDRALDLAERRVVDGILFAPFNKGALRAAGMEHEDEQRYIAARLGHEGPMSEINVLEELMTTRVTSHVPLKDVAAMLDVEGIVRAVRLAHETLRRAGNDRPRIAVCALNPHAGDNGNYGREEIDIIAPAVAQAQVLQIAADGPWPSDTVFLRARKGQADAVVTMYHDQGQIAMKLMGFDRGVTVIGGFPIPIATPAHGTAFDIAGQGIADPGAIDAAFALLCRMTSATPPRRHAA